MRKVPERCPTCGGTLEVTELSCPSCGTTLRGRWTTCPFCKLLPEDLELLETFLRCRGNVKEMERILGLSYPTVRNRVNELLRKLGYGVEEEAELAERRREILDMLEGGEITSSEAIRRLEELGRR